MARSSRTSCRRSARHRCSYASAAARLGTDSQSNLRSSGGVVVVFDVFVVAGLAAGAADAVGVDDAGRVAPIALATGGTGFTPSSIFAGTAPDSAMTTS